MIMPSTQLSRCQVLGCHTRASSIEVEPGIRVCNFHRIQGRSNGSPIHAAEDPDGLFNETVTVAPPRRESYAPLTPLGAVGMGYAELINHSWFEGQFCCRHCCRKCQAVHLMSSTRAGRDGVAQALRAAGSVGQAWQTSAGVRWSTVSARLNICINTARHPEDEDGQTDQF